MDVCHTFPIRLLFLLNALNASGRNIKACRYPSRSKICDSKHRVCHTFTLSCVSNVLWTHRVTQGTFEALSVSSQLDSLRCVNPTHLDPNTPIKAIVDSKRHRCVVLLLSLTCSCVGLCEDVVLSRVFKHPCVASISYFQLSVILLLKDKKVSTFLGMCIPFVLLLV